MFTSHVKEVFKENYLKFKTDHSQLIFTQCQNMKYIYFF